MLQQQGHALIQQTTIGKLRTETLGKRPSKDTRGIKLLQLGQKREDVLLGCTQPLGNIAEIGSEVACLVEPFEQGHGDDALGRAGNVGCDLRRQMLA
jgi:hypothetical protein